MADDGSPSLFAGLIATGSTIVQNAADQLATEANQRISEEVNDVSDRVFGADGGDLDETARRTITRPEDSSDPDASPVDPSTEVTNDQPTMDPRAGGFGRAFTIGALIVATAALGVAAASYLSKKAKG